MSTRVKKIVVGPLETNCYLVGKPGRPGLVVDPGAEVERLAPAIREAGFSSLVFVNTHGHFDHVGANGLKTAFGAQLLVHRLDRKFLSLAGEHEAYFSGVVSSGKMVEPDGFLAEGDELSAGDGKLVVRETPGHSPGSVCLVGQGIVLSGDTLFAGDIGRTDLEGGDPRAMRLSLARLLELPDETEVYPGHGPETSIGAERVMLENLSSAKS